LPPVDRLRQTPKERKTMKRLIALGGVALAVVLAAPAVAPSDAEANYPSRSQIADAKWMARDYWVGYRGFNPPCYGVGIRFERMYGGTLGAAVRRGCTIWLNSRADWSNSWHRLCWTMIHEYGHLYGYGHTRKRSSVMYPYSQRFWYC
jgi:hypothetical protein